jgi:ribosomal protein S8
MDVDTSQAPRSKAALVEVPISRQINNNFDILNSNGYVKSTSNRKRQHEDVDWDIVIQGMTTDAMVISQSQDWMKPNENIEPEKGLATDKKKRFRGDSGELQTELYNDEGNMNM